MCQTTADPGLTWLVCTATGVYLGLLPSLRIFQQEVEARQGRYPVTRSLLELTCSYLERGFVTGPLPAYVSAL